MGLRESLQQELHTSLKSGDTLKVAVIRLIIADIMKLEVTKHNISDDEVVQIIRRQAKQRLESITQFERGSRPDLALREKQELTVLERYMPKQMTEDELIDLVTSTAKEMNFVGKADIGKLMKAVMGKVKGQADGKAINRIAGSLLH